MKECNDYCEYCGDCLDCYGEDVCAISGVRHWDMPRFSEDKNGDD